MSALVVGNALKAGVRFLSFDQFKRLLSDGKGQTKGSSMVLGNWFNTAGLGAGMTEAILVVTPSETIKTKFIHDQNRAQPQYKGLVHGTRHIVNAEGLGGIYRGLGSVVARQGANSAVRMSSYGLMREKLAQYYPMDAQGKPLVPWYVNAVTGSLAGILTVYCTMPLDVVKTRMQSLDASQYKHALDCLYRVGKEEGIKALWKGATPRLGRLVFSGAIVFSVYEAVVSVFDSLNKH